MFSLFINLIFAKRFNVIFNPEQMVYTSSEKLNKEIRSMFEAEDEMTMIYNLGLVVDVSDKTAKKIKKHPKVAIVEEDMEVKIASINFESQENATWGLSRLINPEPTKTIDHFYEYITNTSKVFVYVLDTGIDIDHVEFEGRAEMAYSNVPDGSNYDDNGHGTHCAGIIGSKTFGVAKNVNLIGVKVLDKKGVGSISKLIDGIEFISKDVKNRKGRFIVNMSVGGEKSSALNYIIKYVSKKHNIHFSSAAGNENKDACKFSPSSSSSFTIGAADENNNSAIFSNEGRCVDIFAPGTNILSTWIQNKVKTLSGTSMAAPHVSGVMAVYLGLADFDTKELKNTILRDAVSVVKTDDNGFLSFLPTYKKPLVSLTSLYERLKKYNSKE